MSSKPLPSKKCLYFWGGSTFIIIIIIIIIICLVLVFCLCFVVFLFTRAHFAIDLWAVKFARK
jgi:hypothetical protein